MAKQVYFVVAVDLGTGVPFIDDTVLTARFDSNEQVWDTETEKWESDDEDATLYLKALEILNTVPLSKE
jgi:hypothetical protein